MIALITDTETSDLISNHSVKLEKQPHVIEFFGALTNVATGERLSEYHTLIKPPKPISFKITEITGITNELLADAPPFADVAGRIAEEIASAPAFIAHNCSFDQEVIDIEYERLCAERWLINGAKPQVIWPRTICTVEATIHIKGYRLKLADLYAYLFNGETFSGAHRARADVDALERICIELFARGDL